MTSIKEQTFGNKALALAATIRPLLAGQEPGVQGACLAELVSLWIAGHPEALRDELLLLHAEAVRQLVPVNAVPLDAQRKQLESES